MTRSKSDVDWGFWAKACLLVSLPLLAWTLWPGGQCLGQALGNEGFTALSADDQNWATVLEESGELSRGNSMAQRPPFLRLLYALGPCTQVAFRRSEVWQWMTLVMILLAAGLFFWLKYRQHRRALGQTMTKLAQTDVMSAGEASGATSILAAASAGSSVGAAAATTGRAANQAPGGESGPAAQGSDAALRPRFTASQPVVGATAGNRVSPATSQHAALAGEPVSPKFRTGAPAVVPADASVARGPSEPLDSLGGAALRQAVHTGNQKAVAFAFDDDWDDAPLPNESAALPNAPGSAPLPETIVLPPERELAPTIATGDADELHQADRSERALAATMAPGEPVANVQERALAPTMAPGEPVANVVERALAPTMASGEPDAGRSERALAPTMAPGELDAGVLNQTAPDPQAAQVPESVGEPVRISAFRVPPMTRLGRDIQLAIGLNRPAPEAVTRMHISGVLHGMDRAKTTVLDESITAMDAVADLRRDGRAIVRIPFRVVEQQLRKALEQVTGHLQLEFTLSLDDEEHYAGTRLVDSLTLRLTSALGGPWGPGIVRLRNPVGELLRMGVGASNAGLLRLESIMPGSWQVELEDGLCVHAAQGAPTRKLALQSDFVQAMNTAGPSSSPESREVKVAAPVVVWVRAGATGDGSMKQPCGSIEDAFNIADRQRAGLATPYTPVEIRVFPNGQLPYERPGLVDGSHGQWVRWWAGLTADRRAAWTVAASELPPLPTPDGDALLRPLHFENVDDLRLVNAEYALLREKAAAQPDLCDTLDEAYARIRMVTFLSPESGGEGSRVRFDQCQGVRLEGLQVMGRRGMNALSLAKCEDVMVSRCWFERAAAGPTGQGGSWAPGRGVHVDASGTPEAPIEFSDCDIGWNSVVRRSLPVRGAAVAAYNSHVVMARCYLHDNIATQEPPDVFASGNGSLRGEAASHRAGNIVAQS